MKRKLRRLKMWAGYTDGKMDADWFVVRQTKIYGAIYPARYLAREAYEDVRPVEVRELPRRKR